MKAQPGSLNCILLRIPIGSSGRMPVAGGQFQEAYDFTGGVLETISRKLP